MLRFSSQDPVCGLTMQPLGNSFALGLLTKCPAFPIWNIWVGRRGFAVQGALARKAVASTKAIGLVPAAHGRSPLQPARSSIAAAFLWRIGLRPSGL